MIKAETGTYPDVHKLAKVIPVYKKGTRIFLKIADPLTYSLALINSLNVSLKSDSIVSLINNNVLYDYQFGFGKETNLAMLYLNLLIIYVFISTIILIYLPLSRLKEGF